MPRDDIQQLIPHRDPFLWLDEIIELTESRIHARKTLSPDLPVFAGHYPNIPVFPGVLQLEAAMQAGAILIAKTTVMEPGKVPVATGSTTSASAAWSIPARHSILKSN